MPSKKVMFLTRGLAKDLARKYSDDDLKNLFKINAPKAFRAYSRGLKITFKTSRGLLVEDYPPYSPFCKFNFTEPEESYLISEND